jgi:osmotically inducible protein OsmC
MARRIAHAEWTGEMSSGTGEVRIGGERLGLAYTPAWSGEGAGTNPEELLAAAHAASFAMALQLAFSGARHRAQDIRARAELHLDRREGSWTITGSDLECEIALEEDPRRRQMSQSEFQRIVEDAAASCAVSRALGSVEITVDGRPSGSGGVTEPAPMEPRAVDLGGERAKRDGRSRRAFEGQVVGRMRTQASERQASRR